MEDQVHAMDDQQAEESHEKKSYETPTLTTLGNLRELTKGGAILIPEADGGIIAS